MSSLAERLDPVRLPSKKERLAARDGSHCVWCDLGFADLGQATLDHLVPATRGGTTHDDNTLLACHECNQARGHMPALAFLRLCQKGDTNRRRRLVTAALGRAVASSKLEVGCRALAEVLYEAQPQTAAEVELLLAGYQWPRTDELKQEVGRRYLWACERSQEVLEQIEAAARERQGMSRREFCESYALRLSGEWRQMAAMLVFVGKQELALEKLRTRFIVSNVRDLYLQRKHPKRKRSSCAAEILANCN